MPHFKEIRTSKIISSRTLQELTCKLISESTDESVLVFYKRGHIYILVMQGRSNTSGSQSGSIGEENYKEIARLHSAETHE